MATFNEIRQIYKRDENAKERTRKNIEHRRVDVASINTEQDNSNNVLF